MMISTRSANQASPSHHHHHPGLNGFLVARTACLGLARLIFAASFPASLASAAPLLAWSRDHTPHDDIPNHEAAGGSLVLYLASASLVLLGGAFAGLTIAFMGQDSIYLRVVSKDPTEPQAHNAKRVFDLLQKGKHWVLVTLLLSNVIVNETLPVVLDRCLGGGVAAVVGATVLIVIFGEVIPQSLCVRYGLQIGGSMSGPVLVLMYLMAPIAWPTAKLLDHMLGEDHGTVYKKSGLKTLVTLHKSLGEVSERLNQDEVTIISAVLDLKEKPVGEVMTPMEDVFTMSEDTVLDEKTMDMILSAGYSRIPIHETGHPTNFVGMLLVKILITYDPEDAKTVREFPLATLPETRPETSCLDIINFFQQGSSHLVLVSEYPGEDQGALGVVTLEDVIEELIGEEIIDESDVYIDVHKAIRRLTPAPKARVMRKTSETGIAAQSGEPLSPGVVALDGRESAPSAPGAMTARWLRRGGSASSGGGGSGGGGGGGGDTPSATKGGAFSVRANLNDIKPHLSHLGPKNSARNPRPTNSLTVKVKPGTASQNMPRVGETAAISSAIDFGGLHHPQQHHDDHEGYFDETSRLLSSQGEPRAAAAATSPAASPLPITAKDGVQALSQSYGSVGSAASAVDLITGRPKIDGVLTAAAAQQAQQQQELPPVVAMVNQGEDILVDLSSTDRAEIGFTTRGVRTGSISETVLETRGGVRKIVLEASSSTEEDERGGSPQRGGRTRSLTSRGSAQSGSSSLRHTQKQGAGAADGAAGEEGTGTGTGTGEGSPSTGSESGRTRKEGKKP